MLHKLLLLQSAQILHRKSDTDDRHSRLYRFIINLAESVTTQGISVKSFLQVALQKTETAMNKPITEAEAPGTSTVHEGPVCQTPGPPSRQTLFPMPDSCVVSADALSQAEATLRNLGYTLDSEHPGIWKISWPGTALKIWRYSPAELCHFVHHQARHYRPKHERSARPNRTLKGNRQ